MRIDLGVLKRLSGFFGAAVVDSETGLILGRLETQGRSLEAAAAGNMEVIRAARRMVHTLEVDDDVEDTVVALGQQLHLTRTVRAHPAIFLYVALDRGSANLAAARITLKQVEDTIRV